MKFGFAVLVICNVFGFQEASAQWSSELEIFPDFNQATFYSDGTERGGGTQGTISVLPNEAGIILSGELRGIVNPLGNRVGFAGVRFPVRLSAGTRFLRLKVQYSTDLVVRAVLRTARRAIGPVQGELTYQTVLLPPESSGFVQVEFDTLRPVIRGREIDVDQAPAFLPEEVVFLAIELRLSDQVLDPDLDSIPFEVTLVR